jgi:hypothetical protein
MKRLVTYVALDTIASATLNEWQDNTRGAYAASSNNQFTSSMDGGDARYYQANLSLADATLVEVDSSIDWRDRVLSGWCKRLAAADRVGQSTDYNLDDPSVAAIATSTFAGCYTGTGAYSSTAGAGVAVANGSPPVNNATGATRSYAPIIDTLGTASTSGNVYLYADPSTGALSLYNASGGALVLQVFVECSGDTGLR